MPDKMLDNLANNIRNANTALYSDIYYNNNVSNQQIKSIKSKIDKALQNISNTNLVNTGMSNISSLYNKTIASKERDQANLYNNINNVLGNKSVMDNVLAVYTQNTMVRDIDREIDMVCKYMPKLEDALETRKEHVLSADHFTKNPIIIKSSSNIDNKEDPAIENNIDTMIRKYNLNELMDQIYDDTDKRGECFVYIVPYKKAMEELLKERINDVNGHMQQLSVSQEQVDMASESINRELDMIDIFTEEAEEFEDLTAKYKMQAKQKEEEQSLLDEASQIKFTLNKSGIITSAINNYYKANRVLNETASIFMEDDTGTIGATASEYSSTAQDGVSLLNMPKNSRSTKVKIPGCVVKILDHTMVKPLYIDNICLGYFYIECENKIALEQTTFSSSIGGIRPGGFNKTTTDPYGSYGNEYIVLKDLASKISQKIDAEFINANQDLSKEIYSILKYNATVDATGKVAKVNITFIPPEDIEHCYFDFDRDTKRGISGLLKSLFPAKLFSCLYISNVIQNLTRGNDRRVFYIKQSVDTNIIGVISNVINQIQRSNFGLRQIESMANVLNMLGRFNDFVIPRSPSGDAPIDFEVIPGQQVETKTDLMNMLEEAAVNATEVPIEVIQMRQQVDYATHLTMTNTKFLQKIYNRQGKTQQIFSKIITKIYNYEFDENGNDKQDIQVILPPPIYLNAINGTQVIDAVNNIGDSLSNIVISEQEENLHAGQKAETARLIKQSMIANVIPENIIQNAIVKAKLNLAQTGGEE